MGRASRKKNRLRGQSGGLYSSWSDNLYREVKKNAFTHYYISNENVVDFLFNNKIKKDDILPVAEFIKNNFNPYIPNGYWKDVYSFCIHYLNRKYSTICWVTVKENKITTLYSKTGKDSLSLIHIPIDKRFDLPKHNPGITLFLYMDAFPEAVRQGPPPVKIYNGPVFVDNTIVGESTEIKDTYRNGVTPHMRRGHFRFLQSEKFKKKRYQTIYIKPTMIKGHAEHIIEGTIND